MSNVTIESLNRDVLLELFEHLDAKSLKCCTLVCKQWDSIIGSSVSTMRKLPLVLRSNWDQSEKFIKGLKRKFHSVLLDSVTISDNKLLKVLKNIGTSVRCLELEQVQVKHSSFTNILDSLKLLEKLSISECDIVDFSKITASVLKKLDSFVLIHSNWLFLEYVSQTQVRKFKIASQYPQPKLYAFEKFLSVQRSLEILAIHVHQGDVYKSLAKYDETSHIFKLKQISIDFKYWGVDSEVDDAFIKFLKHHKDTLQNLEAQKNLSEKVLEFIMMNLKIKRLIIEADRLVFDPLFYSAIPQNNYLNTLIIKGELSRFEVARGLFHVYKSTKNLIVSNWHQEIVNDILVYIANTLKTLQHLEIPTLANETPELPIPTLKILIVNFVDDVVQFQTICVNNPSIEQLSVKWLTNRDTFTYEVIDTITTRLRNLKHIRFGAYFKPTERILELMTLNCPNLKVLEVFVDNIEEQQSSINKNVGNFMIIYFPHEAVRNIFTEEPTIWSEEKNYDPMSDSGSDFSDDDYSMDDFDDSDGWDVDNDGQDFDDLIYFY